MTNSYRKELDVAVLAAQRAALLTRRVFRETLKGTVDKDDKSPVTIGDFGAQALIISALKQNFPEDGIIAEEEASFLRSGPGEALRNRVWKFVQNTRLDNDATEAMVGGAIESVDTMMDLIDAGNSPGGPRGRIWTIDPIDGTKGFLRGGQYAVCVGLIVDGHVKVGVLACPNLPLDDSARLDARDGVDQTETESRGVIFSAVAGLGATSCPLGAGGPSEPRVIAMKAVVDLSDACFCESFESSHSNHGSQTLIAQQLGITRPGVRMDSQAKYGSIARGAGDIYLRLPVSATYEEKIWDHAAGTLIVKESGGRVTDIHGNELDFGRGKTLERNGGVVAASVAVHDRVLQAVQQVLGGSTAR